MSVPPRRQAPHVPAALEALVACVRGDPTERLEGPLRAWLGSGPPLAEYARYHGLLSLLHRRLRETGLHSLLPPAQVERLTVLHLAELAAQTRLSLAAQGIIAALRQADVGTVLPLKGLALAALLWPEPLPRRTTDIDLLVPVESLAAGQEALEKLGFACGVHNPQDYAEHHHAPALVRDRVCVELHTGLWSAERLPFPSPDAATVAGREVQGHLFDMTLAVPSPEDLLLMVAGVLARERFYVRLANWADLYWLVTHVRLGVDPQRLLTAARSLRLAGLLGVVLSFAEELFAHDALVPGADWPEAPMYPWLRSRLWERLLTQDAGRWRHILALDFLDGWSRRRGAAPPPSAVPRPRSLPMRYGGVARTGLKALSYLAYLALHPREWRGLTEEVTLRRALRRLGAAPQPPAQSPPG